MLDCTQMQPVVRTIVCCAHPPARGAAPACAHATGPPPVDSLVVFDLSSKDPRERPTMGIVHDADVSPSFGVGPRHARILVSANDMPSDLVALSHVKVEDFACAGLSQKYLLRHIAWDDLRVIAPPRALPLGAIVKLKPHAYWPPRDWAGVVIAVDSAAHSSHKVATTWNAETGFEHFPCDALDMMGMITPFCNLPLTPAEVTRAAGVVADMPSERAHFACGGGGAGGAAAAAAGAAASDAPQAPVVAPEAPGDAVLPNDDDMHAELVKDVQCSLTRGRVERSVMTSMRRMFCDGTDTGVLLFNGGSFRVAPHELSLPAMRTRAQAARVFAVDREWDAVHALMVSRDRFHLYGGNPADFLRSRSLLWSRAIVVGVFDARMVRSDLLPRASQRSIVTFITEQDGDRVPTQEAKMRHIETELMLREGWHLKEERRCIVTSDGRAVTETTYVNHMSLLVGWDMEDLDRPRVAALSALSGGGGAAAVSGGSASGGAGRSSSCPCASTETELHHTYCT